MNTEPKTADEIDRVMEDIEAIANDEVITPETLHRLEDALRETQLAILDFVAIERNLKGAIHYAKDRLPSHERTDVF